MTHSRLSSHANAGKKRLFKLERDLLSYYEPPKPAGRASSGARPASTGRSVFKNNWGIVIAKLIRRDEKLEVRASDLVLKGSISIAVGKTLVTVCVLGLFGWKNYFLIPFF